MQYKIIVDKQPSSNPSSEKKEYTVDIEELRVKGNVYDSLNIEMNRTYVTRRLSLSQYGVLSVLSTPITEELPELNIELFEGDNYIYLMNMYGNKIYAEYIVKNDFTDTYVTQNTMSSAIRQSAQNIEISVNQKLEGYSTTEEMNSSINMSANTIMTEVNKKVGEDELGTKIEQNAESVRVAWNNFSQFIQLQILSGNASLVVKDNSQNVLMSLDKNGQHFFEASGNEIGDMGVIQYQNTPMLAFNLNVEENNNKGMAWGIEKNGTFYPIFYTVATYHVENGEYGGSLTVEGELFATKLESVSGKINLLSSNNFNAEKIGGKNGNPPIIINSLATGYYEGYPMTGINQNYTYQCQFLDDRIWFYADGNLITSFSDKRLKKDIEEVDEKLVDIIGELKIYQFKFIKNDKKTNIGIMAQELEEVARKYDVEINDYEIIRKIPKEINGDELYYQINYEQFLLLRQLYTEKKTQEQQKLLDGLQKEILELKEAQNG